MVTGDRLVRLIYPAHKDCERLFPTNRDKKIIWRHAQKLRYWPKITPTDSSGPLLDSDWNRILACKGLRVGELRVNESIAGFNNWRIIFFEGPRPWAEGETRKIWVLQIMKKKRNEFTSSDIQTIRLRRTLVMERYYGRSG